MMKIMTINDQIRDEKLQYDVNREAAKISFLSSGKIHKYEYLTGEDILPSNQQQIIEQTKFTYSPLEKAFEKQIKTIENQEEKQIDALKDLKETKSDDDDKTSTTKEIYNEILEERIDEILQMNVDINYNSLVYDFKGLTASIDFSKYEDPLYIYGHIKNGDVTLQQVEEEQKKKKKN